MAKKLENPFGEGILYVRTPCATFAEWAQDSAYPMWVRVKYAAYANINRNGHAEFSRGELGQVLGTVGAAGVWAPASASSVSNAVKSAKEHGAILPESNARCLVLDEMRARQGWGTYGCRTHGIFTTRRKVSANLTAAA